MPQDVKLMFLMLVLGLMGKNQLVIISVSALLFIKLCKINPVLLYLEKLGVKTGLILLIISVIAPMATGRIATGSVLEAIKSPAGAMAILGGAFAAYLGGKGVAILEINPQIIVGLIIGSILGTSFFNGVPVGPLVAAGFAAVFLELAGYRW